jgi:hypothetical protein
MCSHSVDSQHFVEGWNIKIIERSQGIYFSRRCGLREYYFMFNERKVSFADSVKYLASSITWRSRIKIIIKIKREFRDFTIILDNGFSSLQLNAASKHLTGIT